MYVKHNQVILYEVMRNGVLFRSFATRGNALAFIAAARELCPESLWVLHETDVGSDRQLSGKEASDQ